MRQIGTVIALVLMINAGSAHAVIKELTPLQKLTDQSTFICTAKVEKLLPEKPAMILAIDGDMKGKVPFRSLPINLLGDREGQKLKHPEEILKRLAPDLPLVMLILKSGADRYVAFGYTNGTWFQLVGTKDKDGDTVRWLFTHGEPYLRRTFKGTTDEMRKTLQDVLDGKKKAPEPNGDEEPGFGPEVKPKSSSQRGVPESPHLREGLAMGGPLFAVIGAAPLSGLIAFLAVLFPTVFGGLLIVMRRWAVLIGIVFTNSTIVMLYSWFRLDIQDKWWGKPGGILLAMTLLTVIGTFWSWRRNLGSEPEGQARPTPTETWTLGILSAASLIGIWAYATWGGELAPDGETTLPPTLGDPVWMFILITAIGFWAGTLNLIARLLRTPREDGPPTRPAMPMEGVMLCATVAACVIIMGLRSGPTAGASTTEGSRDLTSETGNASHAGSGRAVLKRVVWKFQPDTNIQSAIASSPIVAGNRVLIGINHGNAFEKSGVVYCLNRDTGKEVWRFDNGGDMKQMFSSPFVADGKIYIGEGFHENSGCRLFCIHLADGKKAWEFETESHTESSPAVADGKVYFGAGDDGLYCVDTTSGKKLWRYPEQQTKQDGLHIDASPTVVNGRVYCSSGVSRTYRKLQVFCLDAKTGKQVWARDDIDLPAWGSPTIEGDQVFVGLGNGRLTESDKNPKGALLCLDAKDGKRLWYFNEAGDGVHTKAAADRHCVWFASRDGYCYCLDRHAGRLLWKKNLGSPSVSSPALGKCDCCGATACVYAAATDGITYCLDPASGTDFWKFDEPNGHGAMTLASPALEMYREKDVVKRRVYVATGVLSGAQAVVYCLEDEWTTKK